MSKNEYLHSPNAIEKLIDYQAGTVVSKTMIKQLIGAVSLFAFYKGEELSKHTAPFDALVYSVNGVAEITIAGKVNIVKQGEMILMPANQPHALKAKSRFKMMLVMIKS